MPSIMVRSPGSTQRRRPMASVQKEVDAIENPTELFQRINSGDWDGALHTLHKAKAEASVWVSRWSKRSNKIAWKYLPLHLVCLHQKPPWPLLKALLEAYPQAASAQTQHDGNLPIHYICESGCNDVNVLGALISTYPNCMSVMNQNDKTPLMICHSRTKSVLKKVLKQVLPSQQANLIMESPRSSNLQGKDQKSRIDQRNALHTSRDTVSHQHHEQRQLPDTLAKDHKTPEHRSMNNFNFTYSLSSDDTEMYNSPSRSRYFNSAQTPTDKQQSSTSTPSARKRNPHDEVNQSTPSELTGQLQQFSFSTESSDNMKLCDRILAKAESESVKLRAQIEQLQTQKNKLEEKVKLKDSLMEDNMNTLTKALIEQGERSRIVLFQPEDESSNPNLECITETVLTLLSHIEMNNEKVAEHVTSLQAQVSEIKVQHKSALATNLALQQEKQIIAGERDNLETMVTTLESDKESLQNELSHEKETTSSLRVINQSLQEQIDAAIGELPGHERNLRSQLRCLNADLQKMKDEKKNSIESQRYQKQIASLLEEQKSMREKNQSLKETIRENNELYSRKMMELEKKFEEIEQSNKMFRLQTKETIAGEDRE